MKKSINKYLTTLGIVSLSLISCAVQQQQKPEITAAKKSETTPIAIGTKPDPAAVTQAPTTTKVTESVKVDLPEVKREFRAAWVATVDNISLPSSKNLSTQEQKNEAIILLDLLQDAHFNTVICQVRPAAEALYKS